MHFVRHGQSHFNVVYDAQGYDPHMPDAPLTERGREQARRAAAQLQGKGLRRVIASPYTRALQTASVIASHLGLGIDVEPLAGERALYSCDIGSPAEALKRQWPDLDFSHVAEKWWPDLGESAGALAARIEAFKAKWRDRILSGEGVLVSHWYFLNGIADRDMDNGEVAFRPIFSGK